MRRRLIIWSNLFSFFLFFSPSLHAVSARERTSENWVRGDSVDSKDNYAIRDRLFKNCQEIVWPPVRFTPSTQWLCPFSQGTQTEFDLRLHKEVQAASQLSGHEKERNHDRLVEILSLHFFVQWFIKVLETNGLHTGTLEMTGNLKKPKHKATETVTVNQFRIFCKQRTKGDLLRLKKHNYPFTRIG